MLYTIINTHADGTQTTHTITADNTKQAHEQAQATATAGDIVRTYPVTADTNGNIIADGIQVGALTVVKRTTANMVTREGGKIQFKLYNECRRPIIIDHDVLDCISVAQLALLEAIADGADIAEQYHSAYLALNKHLRANRQINLSATAQRTLYIEDIDGDIINVYGAINHIIKADERYTPTAIDENTDPNTLTQYSDIIHAITATLTPTQKTVLKYLARGYSERQTAQAMRRSQPTIHEHITFIRKKAKALYPNGYKA